MLDDENEQFQGSFSHFSPPESAVSPGARVHGHSSSWTPVAYEQPTPGVATAEGFFIDDSGGVWMRMDSGLWKLLGTDVFRAEPG